MQTTMVLDACARCGQPIAPGEPAMQTASVDIIGRKGGLHPGEVLPPEGPLLRRREAAGAPPQRRIDGSYRAAITRPSLFPPRNGWASPIAQPKAISYRKEKDMNLGQFIDTFKEAIAKRVVESFPPLYRPSENGGKMPRLLRKPLGAQADAIRGAALSLEAHRGTTVVGEMGTGKTFIVQVPPLSEDKLYPKEKALVDLVAAERMEGRRVLVYATHTGTRDITERMDDILTRHGFRVAVMKADAVAPERREAWVADRVKEGIDVMICHPRLVQTGLDLIDFPTLCWFETEFSVFQSTENCAVLVGSRFGCSWGE